MDYSAAVAYVESLGKFGIHLGMERIQGLVAQLDHPERKIRTIHVTGTNGKGSVTTFLANMLQQEILLPLRNGPKKPWKSTWLQGVNSPPSSNSSLLWDSCISRKNRWIVP